MFTGIVEDLGEVMELRDGRLTVRSRVAARDAGVGDSIAVNGICLTVVDVQDGTISFDLSSETLARSAAGRLAAGAHVNLERPATLAGRLGGHLVQGHVDGVGTVAGVEVDAAGGAELRVRVPAEFARYIVEKGSIAIDGVSLTVAAIDGDAIVLALIPHTLAVTTLGAVRAGDPVNLEVDVIAKYVERLMERIDR
jgi:riboflavin synthase